MEEITIDSHVYRIGKLDAFAQLHIARRLTPCLGRLAALEAMTDRTAILAGIGDVATALRDEDLDYVLNACLDVTERKQSGGKWAPLRANGAVMFDGLTLPVLLQVAFHVIRRNLGDFSGALPSLSVLEDRLKGLLSAG